MSEPTSPASVDVAITRNHGTFRKVAIGLVIALAVLFAMLWFLNRNRESTDDAFIEANVVQISPHVGGYVAAVAVEDNQPVKQGDLLVQIDSRDFTVRVSQAEAALAAAKARHGASKEDLSVVAASTQANIREAAHALESARAQRAQAAAQAQLAAQDVPRYQALFDKEEISRQRLDQALTAQTAANAQLASAEAQVRQADARLAVAQTGPQQVALKRDQAASGHASVDQARAELDQARLDLDYTKLVAPVAGRVARKSVFQGQLIQPGTSVMAIVYGKPWVIANFKETQLQRVRPGQPVTIHVDAFSGKTFKGHVDSIQQGTGARFSLLPPENATGNYVKVIQRVPVKIVFDDPPEALSLLVPGMSVEPTVELRDGAANHP